MSTTMVPAHVVGSIDLILKAEIGVTKKWAQVEEVLLNAGLAYKQICDPSLFLVHPLNRGGTGINPFACHRKGATICSTGADLNQLGGSVAFELAIDESERNEQIKFNTLMASNSNKMLPSPTGHERFFTCSKGHTVQFCKAVMQACSTKQQSLAGPDNCSTSHLLVNDRYLHHMCHKGWQWAIISAAVAKQWPQLPCVAEAAGNASNSIYES